jgi:rhamnulose-1-phosphate aldolase
VAVVVSASGLSSEIEKIILDCGEVGFLLWRKGWCEGAAGNMSVLVDYPNYHSSSGPSHTLSYHVPDLNGRCYIVTASGKRFRDIAKQPDRCLGIVRIIDQGRGFVVEWGFLGGGRATSELSAHLAVHQQRLRCGKPINAVLHAHSTNLIALSFVERFRRDPELLMGILYRMHTEAYQGLPTGISYIGFRVPGGDELATDAAAALTTSDVALWSHHGVVGVGDNVDDAMDLMEYADKAAQLFLMISQRNDSGAYLSEHELRELKDAYHQAVANRMNS